jgi:hypothetical protein
MQDRTWLIVGGVLSAVAALAHLAVIAGGPDWYRFFGAGEGMARAAERGELRPALITVAIAAMLFVWAAYAFSGAGLIPRLPLLRTGLVAISAVYLLRAMAPIPILLFQPNRAGPFLWWSSGIVLVYGLFYAIGTHAAWPRLSGAG